MAGNLFQRIFKKKKKLTDYTPEEIHHEEKRLEIREGQLVAEIERMDQEKETIFEQGAKTKSLSRRKIYARRFNDLMNRVKLEDRELTRVTKEIMTLSRIRTVLERRQGPLASLLASLNEKNMAELQSLLEDDRINEEFYLQKIDSLLGITTDPAYEADQLGSAGLEVLKTWEAMDEGEIEYDEGMKKAEKSRPQKESPDAT